MQSAAERSLSPQVRIYNRYFYKKEHQHQLLQDISQREIRMAANLPKITPSSYAILSKKMLAELEQHITAVVGKDEYVGYDAVEQLVRIYVHSQSMSKYWCYAAHDEQEEEKALAEQLYLVLCHYNLENQPVVEQLFSMLRILLDPYGHSSSEQLNLIKSLPNFKDIEQKRNHFVKYNPECAQETLPIGQLLQIWRKLRLKNNTFQKQKERASLAQEQHSFKPTVGKKSQQLAQKQYNKQKQELEAAHTTSEKRIGRHEVLYSTKLNRDVPNLKIESNSECTFKPNINRASTSRHDISQDFVERLYHVPDKKEGNYRIAQQEEQLKLCTFKPKLVSPGKVSTASSSRPKQVKNYEKSVGRMALARSRKQQLQQLYDNLGKVQKRSSLQGVPPSMLDKEPKVILEIKVDEYRVQKIKLYGNQQPRIVASRFVRKNGLPEQMIEVVEELVQQYSEKYI